MGAAVLQNANSVVVASDHDYLVAPELASDEVTSLLDLAFVPDKDPSAFEDPFHLELEDRRIGVKAPVRAVGFHQGANLDRIKCHRRDLIGQLRWWGHGLQHGR